jgi:hypothetical protein
MREKPLRKNELVIDTAFVIDDLSLVKALLETGDIFEGDPRSFKRLLKVDSNGPFLAELVSGIEDILLSSEEDENETGLDWEQARIRVSPVNWEDEYTVLSAHARNLPNDKIVNLHIHRKPLYDIFSERFETGGWVHLVPTKLNGDEVIRYSKP